MNTKLDLSPLTVSSSETWGRSVQCVIFGTWVSLFPSEFRNVYRQEWVFFNGFSDPDVIVSGSIGLICIKILWVGQLGC
ncbi:hypothetical protein Nepgr_005880 [Nepenthes gracilis]|uniref:Uncharacterized protein n=1 Tax=Nepenthes gracilis TaxID=150966 RepID=A0AAD3S4E2_NEPGR|nr:hypothetical protein Nepgr_005880 [Nepenthes gracilis]